MRDWGGCTAGYAGVFLSDPWLQNQFTQVELRSLNSSFAEMRRENGGSLKLCELAEKISSDLTEEETTGSGDSEVDFELFLRVHLRLQGQSSEENASAFLKSPTSTLIHTISESEKSSYVSHINNYLAGDEFLSKYLPIDPSTDDLFEIAKDGILICKLINVAVPGTIDERALNTKTLLNPWERNENHTLCLNSAKAIGCTVVNIGTQDFIEGRRHLVLGVISQIIKIQLLANLNLKKTPQLVELVDDSKDVEELMSLAPEKILLRWMNFQLKKGGYLKTVTNFSSDVKDAEAYAHLLNVLAPEHTDPSVFSAKEPLERAKLVLHHADRMGCRRYLTPRDIVDGSPNLNLAFVAHIFQHRNGLSSSSSSSIQTAANKHIEDGGDDPQISREERVFRFWLNSQGSSSYIDNVFEDLRDGWILLETLDRISPGTVDWKAASPPPIRMPFRKVENCNQVVKIGKQIKFSLVNIAGNDIVEGNKKLILAYLWQLMRHQMLQLLKSLRFHGKEIITDGDILTWANHKVSAKVESFKDKRLSSGMFYLELLSSVHPRSVDWSVVTGGRSEEEKRMNARYVISIARKMGCSIFLLPEDIMEVNQKMMLMLTATIMYWTLMKPPPQQNHHQPPQGGGGGSSSASDNESSGISLADDDSASLSSTDDSITTSSI